MSVAWAESSPHFLICFGSVHSRADSAEVTTIRTQKSVRGTCRTLQGNQLEALAFEATQRLFGASFTKASCFFRWIRYELMIWAQQRRHILTISIPSAPPRAAPRRCARGAPVDSVRGGRVSSWRLPRRRWRNVWEAVQSCSKMGKIPKGKTTEDHGELLRAAADRSSQTCGYRMK